MEATPEQAAEGLALVRVLAAVLDRLVYANSQLAAPDHGQITKFHALKAPGIDILQYLERIHKYASCSNECFILALIYIDRLIQRNNFLLTGLNVHRVVITSILLAAKFFDDAYYNNAYYAKVGGVLAAEMNGLEVDFLFRINFSLHVSPELFDKYRAELMSHSVITGLPPQPALSGLLPMHGAGMIPMAMAESAVMPSVAALGVACPQDMVINTHTITPSPQIDDLQSVIMAARSGANEMLMREAQPPIAQPPITQPQITQPPITQPQITQIAQPPIAEEYAYYGAADMAQPFLQRANSLPVSRQKPPMRTTYPLAPNSRHCAPPFSAPMVSMVADGMHIPNGFDAPERFVVVDNQIYPFQLGSILQQQHVLGVEGILHNGGNAFGHMDVGYKDAQHFAVNQMLAGISGGL